MTAEARKEWWILTPPQVALILYALRTNPYQMRACSLAMMMGMEKVVSAEVGDLFSFRCGLRELTSEGSTLINFL